MRIRERFNPRAPCGARPGLASLALLLIYFNPRAPCGARQSRSYSPELLGNFNPRAPCGARRLFYQKQHGGIIFQPTRPLRGATSREAGAQASEDISTHAPLAGRDRRNWLRRTQRLLFQPTRPLRGATFLLQGHRGAI